VPWCKSLFVKELGVTRRRRRRADVVPDVTRRERFTVELGSEKKKDRLHKEGSLARSDSWPPRRESLSHGNEPSEGRPL
jgi:hypothetical protein